MVLSLDILIPIIKTAVIFVAVIQVVPVMVWVERRGAGLIQDRPGPNRVGPFGLLQGVADVLKALWKEDPLPSGVNRLLYRLGPLLSLMPASLVLAALPFGDVFRVGERSFPMQISTLDIGVLYVLAIGSLSVYGIMLGGWASNNKFSLLGAMRSASQILSYEIPMGLAVAAAVAFYGSLSLREIALAQEGVWFGFLPKWGIFVQPFGALVFLIAAFAETNRLPFDLPETEAELVGGYHTEYSAMKFATYMMAEYMSMTTASALLTTLYFGGWHLPWIPDSQVLSWVGGSINWLAFIQFSTVFLKIGFFLLLFVWIRWTIPRFRYDQLLRLAWRNLLPLGMVNLIFTAWALYYFGAAA